MNDSSLSTIRTTRRGVLTIGSLGAAGLALPQLLRADAVGGGRRKSVILVHLDGGPPQYETIDPKPDAPIEIRGPFMPTATSLPGVQISELMPQVAAAADKFVFIRSLVGSNGRHDAFQCQSGFPASDLESMGGRPAFGSIITHLKGSPEDDCPTFIDLMQGRPLVRNSARPGFLGPSVQPFRPDISQMFPRELESGMKGELARLGSEHQLSLTLSDDLTFRRLADRQALRGSLDRLRSEIDDSGMMAAMDEFEQQAVGILTSGRLAEALDLESEPSHMLDRYTAAGSREELASYTSEGPLASRKFLLARRLIEAGARVVSLSISDFDTHSNNFERMGTLVPIVDHGLSTLVADLDERGMLDDVLIVAWGEFGRTPKVNESGGRDHWPSVGPCLLAGGGLRTGQVIGSTDRTASAVTSRPVHYQDVFATLYHKLGINPHVDAIIDPQGRPQHLVTVGEAIHEIV